MTRFFGVETDNIMGSSVSNESVGQVSLSQLLHLYFAVLADTSVLYIFLVFERSRDKLVDRHVVVGKSENDSSAR